jgi:hypothetical protein
MKTNMPKINNNLPINSGDTPGYILYKINHKVIIGPLDDAGELQYWKNETREWTSEYDEATRYLDNSVLSGPIPTGAEGIMEFTPEHEPVQLWEVIVLPRWEPPF